MLARIRKATEEKDQGFTLIELLVVMIIIGILAAIAIPVFLNQRKKAVDSSLKSDLRTVANEMETRFVDTQSYPASAAASTSPLGIAVSTGNQVQIVTATDGTFCLLASRVTGASAASNNWVYKSGAGGLQASTVTTCA